MRDLEEGVISDLKMIDLVFFIFLFNFIFILFYFSNLELEFSIILYVTVTKYYTSVTSHGYIIT